MGRRKRKLKGIKPGDEQILGRHPVTNVLHRLTLYPNGGILIERCPYVYCQKSRYTGELIIEQREYADLVSEQESQFWLIETIRRNTTTSYRLRTYWRRLKRYRLVIRRRAEWIAQTKAPKPKKPKAPPAQAVQLSLL